MRLDLALAILVQSLPELAESRLALGSRRLQKNHRQTRRIQEDLWFTDAKSQVSLGANRPHAYNAPVVARQELQEKLRVKFGDEEGALKNDEVYTATTECDPRAEEDPDLGILSCGTGYYCMESVSSPTGGFCMEEAGVSQNERFLLTDLGICEPDDEGFGPVCDCPDIVNGTGSVVGCEVGPTCLYLNETLSGDFGSIACYGYTQNATYTADIGLESRSACYYGIAPKADPVYRAYACYSYTYDVDGNYTSCDVSIDHVTCTSCEPIICEDGSQDIRYNCTNTRLGSTGAGDTCGREILPLVNAINMYIGYSNYSLPPKTDPPTPAGTEPPATVEPTSEPTNSSALPLQAPLFAACALAAMWVCSFI